MGGIAAGSRRMEIHILIDVLSAVRDETLKTRIMYRANLSRVMLLRYMTMLGSHGFVEAREESGYRLTSRGHDFLARLHHARKLLLPPEALASAPAEAPSPAPDARGKRAP